MPDETRPRADTLYSKLRADRYKTGELNLIPLPFVPVMITRLVGDAPLYTEKRDASQPQTHSQLVCVKNFVSDARVANQLTLYTRLAGESCHDTAAVVASQSQTHRRFGQ